MAQSKNSFLSALASSVTSSGTVPSAALAPEVTSSIEGAGTAVYDSAALLPISGNTAGDTAFVKSTSRLYIHSGVGWYNVAVINNTPTVQSITDSDGGTTPFALAIDGTPTTITVTAQDSDGDPLTYNYSADSGFNGLATISQDVNVFTITPFSEDSATSETGTITFTVSDGINTATPGTQTFTLTFSIDWSTLSNTPTSTLFESDVFPPYESGVKADFSGSNDYEVVVGDFAETVGSYTNAGAFHIYASSNSGTTWSLDTTINHPNPTMNNANFGYKVGRNGDFIITGTNENKAFIFKRANGTWPTSATATLTSSDGTNVSYKNCAIYGNHAAILADGVKKLDIWSTSDGGTTWSIDNTFDNVYNSTSYQYLFDYSGQPYMAQDIVVVGFRHAPNTSAGLTNVGGILYYTHSNGTWTENLLNPNDTASNNMYYGNQLMLSFDGTRLVMGSSGLKKFEIWNWDGSSFNFEQRIDLGTSMPNVTTSYSLTMLSTYSSVVAASTYNGSYSQIGATAYEGVTNFYQKVNGTWQVVSTVYGTTDNVQRGYRHWMTPKGVIISDGNQPSALRYYQP